MLVRYILGLCDAQGVPSGASVEGGMYVMALIYLEPARKTDPCANGASGEDLVHVIAVVSRDAESMRLLEGETIALTCNTIETWYLVKRARGRVRTSAVCAARVADNL